MNLADIFYRAFLSYRKETEKDSKCQKLRRAARDAGAENDKLEAIRSHCIIEEDWVNRIYEGLPFIEKAIREERQFIRQQGEVVPIEKAKRVSKNSVEHLARHSDMITHEPPEDEDLVPDKLYVVERLSDYAVYENRFLYMLLCYLRDFIDIRYSKIIELGHTYKANMAMDKTVKLGKRVLKYKVDFKEEAKDDPFGMFEGESDVLMKKIEEERHIISALLLTPLMKTVSKSPMLKPPITRTNALRMNNNFKNALALYDYVAAYTKDGYRIETQKKTLGPFSDKIGDEFAETIALTSFLVYEYGKDVKAKLNEEYLEEEERRRAEAEARTLAKLAELQKRAKEDAGSLDEYLLLLEERNKELEGDRRKLNEAYAKISELEASIKEHLKLESALKDEIDKLHIESAEKDEEMKRMQEGFEEEKRSMNEAFLAEKAGMQKDFEEKMDSYRQQAEAEMARIAEEGEQKLLLAKQECEQRIETIRADAENKISALDEKIKQKTKEHEDTVSEMRELDKKRCAAEEERRLLSARLHAEKTKNGSIAEEGEFTERDTFTELEAEYHALRDLVKSEWKKTKKKIRHKILWSKAEEKEEETQTDKSEINSEKSIEEKTEDGIISDKEKNSSDATEKSCVESFEDNAGKEAFAEENGELNLEDETTAYDTEKEDADNAENRAETLGAEE